MKRTWTLKYKTGWGEKLEIQFEARDLRTAYTIAQNYCKHNFIRVGRLISDTGRQYII